MNSFIIYDVSGVSGIGITEGIHTFETIDDEMIYEVQMEETNDEIWGITFRLKAGQPLDEDILYKKLQVFLVNINGCMKPRVSNFDVSVRCKKDVTVPDDGKLDLKDAVTISDQISITQSYPISRYEELFSTKSSHPDADILYTLLLNIMKIDNIVTRFLMQYELLLGLVAVDHKQKQVSEYIKIVFNPSRSLNKIGFRPTRREKKAFEEDDITYYRNLLGHNDSSAAIDETTINIMSNAATEVLYYALTHYS